MFGLILAAIPGLLGPLLTFLNKKTDADLEKYKAGVGADATINVSEIQARVQLAQAAMAERSKDRDHWYTAWMVPTAFGVFMLHAGAVVLDSVPLMGHVVGSWHVPALPDAYAAMESNIILTVCGIAAGGSVIKRIFTK
jgi:hypothetical protein